MPVLNHKTPCSECPWRKDSPRGWLGGFPVEWYTDRIRAEHPLVCHMALDAGTPPARDADHELAIMADKPYCAGSLIVQRNMLKSPRDPSYGDVVRQVEKCENVFAHPVKFTEHHT